MVSRQSQLQSSRFEMESRHLHVIRLTEFHPLGPLEKVYGEIWAEPIQHVAKRYKLSDVGLAKVCRKPDIPRPGRGYWAIKAAGKPWPKQPPLPELSIQM